MSDKDAHLSGPQEAPDLAPIELSEPGASLAREYERRTAARERRVRERHPRIGGLLLAMTSEPASTEAFARGAEGERRVAKELERKCGDRALFLHNRRRGAGPRSGDIDHLAVAASGVWVIDAKHYRGAKVEVRRTGGGRTPVTEQLVIRGRDRTVLVASMVKQIEAVREALADPEVLVRGMFCFVGAQLPWLRVPTIQGFALRETIDTIKQLRVEGPYDAGRRQEIWETLARNLPPA